MNRQTLTRSAIILWLALLLCAGCNKQEAETEEEESVANANVEVQAAKVEQGTIRNLIPATGTLTALPDRDVKVSAQVPGRILQLNVAEGDSVSQGQVVAKLDDATLREELIQAGAVLENARSTEQRATRLFERGIAAGKEKEEAHRDLLTAQAAFDTAQIQVSRTVIHSPIAGIVLKRFVSVGEQVDGTANEPIVEVANFDTMELMANISTSYLSSVKEGEEVEVRTDAYGDRAFQGQVFAILPAVDPSTGSATVRIRIPNPTHELKGSMFATASIVGGSHDNVVFLPAAALLNTSEKPNVFVVQADSTVQQREVKLGWRDENKVEILEGVKKGEVVVTTGSYGLAEGMKVTVASKSE